MTVLSTSSTWDYGWWWVPFMVICMAMMMLMMGRGFRGSRWLPWCGLGDRHEEEPRRPDQTLADRLARGEIDNDEYERRLTALHEASDQVTRSNKGKGGLS